MPTEPDKKSEPEKEPTLPPNVAVHNLNQIKWFAVPYPNKSGSNDSRNQGDAPIPLGEIDKKGGTLSKGLGYFLRGALPASSGEFEKGSKADRGLINAIKTSFFSLGIDTKGVGGVVVFLDKEPGSSTTQSIAVQPGWVIQNAKGVLDVYGPEKIKALYKAGVDVPLPKEIAAEIGRGSAVGRLK